MTTCTRRIQFCAGHRVHGHENKCANLHGHNYVLLVTARAIKTHAELDRIGRVVDFSVLNERIGGWIDEKWDHGFLLWKHDNDAIEAVAKVQKQKCYLMQNNPTAENMAKHILDLSGSLLEDTGVELVNVVLWETENCYAEVSR